MKLSVYNHRAVCGRLLSVFVGVCVRVRLPQLRGARVKLGQVLYTALIKTSPPDRDIL